MSPFYFIKLKVIFSYYILYQLYPTGGQPKLRDTRRHAAQLYSLAINFHTDCRKREFKDLSVSTVSGNLNISNSSLYNGYRNQNSEKFKKFSEVSVQKNWNSDFQP